jgi:hypothetical protein
MIIPAFGFDVGIKSANVTAQMRQNLYMDVKTERDKTNIVLYGTPGLSIFNSISSPGSNPFRGVSEQIGNLFYGVKLNTFYEVNNNGTETSRGTISTSGGNVCFSYNGTQVLIVDGTAGYIYTIATTTLTTIVSGNFPNGATTCAFQGGFFLVDDPAHPGRWYKSSSYDGSTWAAADFATAESNPDALVRVWVNRGIVHLLGDSTTEFWSNTGALDFPYSLIQGSPLEWGLAARWSVAKLMGSTAFVAKNLQGHVQIVLLNGLQTGPISSPELEAELDTYSVADAVAFSYMLNGHQFYQVSFPTSGKTWLYDATMSQLAGAPIWSKLVSGTGRHLGQFYVNFINQNITTDYSNGNAYQMLAATYTDNGASIRRVLRSKHIFKNNQQVVIGKLWVDFETGVGLATGQGSNPQVMMRYSKDGGHTWSTELFATLGAIGKYLTRCIWQRLGRARDWVFELAISDPVKVVIINAGIRVLEGGE